MEPISRTKTSKHIYVLYAFIVLLTAAVIALGYLVNDQKNLRDQDNSVIRSYVKDANEALYSPTVVDPKEKKQYVYETELRFPVGTSVQDNFRYNYTPANKTDQTKESIIFTTYNTLNAGFSKIQVANPFDNVGLYQRCSKEFIVQFESGVDEEGMTEAGSKKLTDGRTAYFYKNTGCTDLYKEGSVDFDKHEAVLKSIESY